MNYQVTEQYPRSKETFIAELNELMDVQSFLSIQLARDSDTHTKRIYRVYHDGDLLEVINKDGLAVVQAQYTEVDPELMIYQSLLFSVEQERSITGEKKTLGRFNDSELAQLFVFGKCDFDQGVSPDDLFFIFKGKVLQHTLNKMLVEQAAHGGESQSARFQPSPMPRRPTPFGGVGDCLLDEDDEP
jgi:hypothetical protein